MNIDLETILKLNSSGLFALINDSDKKAYVGYGQNLLSSIARHTKHMLTKEHAIPELCNPEVISKLNLVVLETFEKISDRDLKLAHNRWCVHYMNLGYSLYNKITALAYTLDIEIHNYRAHVILRTRSNKPLTVAIFDKMKDAQDFVAKHYNDELITKVVFGNTI